MKLFSFFVSCFDCSIKSRFFLQYNITTIRVQINETLYP